MNLELLTVLKTGGVAMWIIAFFSVLAVAVAVERALALWRFTDRARSLADAVTRSLLRGDVEDARAQAERSTSPAAEVFLAALVQAPPGKKPLTDARLEAAVERQRQEANQKLRARLWILGVSLRDSQPTSPVRRNSSLRPRKSKGPAAVQKVLKPWRTVGRPRDRSGLRSAAPARIFPQ